jgi:transcriptional regulator with XRE-family HTH domain
VPAPADEELRVITTTVRELRAQRGLTQEAAGLNGGLGRKYFGQLERGEVVPSFPALVGVARGLGVPLSDFLQTLAKRLDRAGVGANASRRPSPAG